MYPQEGGVWNHAPANTGACLSSLYLWQVTISMHISFSCSVCFSVFKKLFAAIMVSLEISQLFFSLELLVLKPSVFCFFFFWKKILSNPIEPKAAQWAPHTASGNCVIAPAFCQWDCMPFSFLEGRTGNNCNQ